MAVARMQAAIFEIEDALSGPVPTSRVAAENCANHPHVIKWP